MHYLAHSCQPTILHCTACCAVLSKLILSLRCVLSGCTVTSRPPCSIGDMWGIGGGGVNTDGERVKYLEKKLSQDYFSCIPGNEPVPVQ